jgi:hypothetical protein
MPINKKKVEAPANSVIQLSEFEIEQVLEIYRPEHRYVTLATLHQLKLECILKPTLYPYTQHEVFGYITAPTATLYACQLAYVLMGGLSLKTPEMVEQLGVGTWSRFVVQRDTAALRFATFSTRFRSEVENSGSIPAYIKVAQTRKARSNLHCIMEFNIGVGISGRVHAVITDSAP